MNRQEQLIDKYLIGEITGSDLTEFETLLKNDKAFAKQVAFELSMRKAARKKQIETFEKINKKTRANNHPGNWWRKGLLWGLGIILLFFVGRRALFANW